MLPTVYKVTEIENGTLSVMAKPVSGEWIEEEFYGLKKLGIDKVVSLLQRHEALELGLGNEQILCLQYRITFTSFPIPDRGVPNTKQARKVVAALYNEIRTGKHIVIHCRAGIGRTGMIAGAVLKEAGYNTYSAIKIISEARRVQIPDTTEQKKWLKNY